MSDSKTNYEDKSPNAMLSSERNSAEDANQDAQKNQDSAKKVICLTKVLETEGKDFTETDILKEDVQKIFENLSRRDLNALLISGPGGCGKTTIVEYMCTLINKNKCPENFKNHIVMKFTNDLFSEMCYEAEYKELLFSVLSFLLQNGYTKVILFFENLEEFPPTIFSCFKRLKDSIEETFEFESIKYLMEAKSEFLNSSNILSVSYSFVTSVIFFSIGNQYTVAECAKVLKPRIKELEKFHKVKISKEAVSFLNFMDYSKSSDYTVNLKLFLYTIDVTLARAKILGEKEVTPYCMQQTYSTDFETENKLSKNQRYCSAIHEAGHTLIAILFPENVKFTAVKCVYDETKGFGGITLLNVEYFKKYQDKKNIKRVMSLYLAGRISEIAFGGKPDIGATADLKKVYDIAQMFVYEAGAVKSLGINYFYDEEKDISGRSLELLEDEIKKLIAESTKLTEKLVKKHKKFIEILAKELMKKKILSAKEVKKLWKEYNKKKKK